MEYECLNKECQHKFEANKLIDCPKCGHNGALANISAMLRPTENRIIIARLTNKGTGEEIYGTLLFTPRLGYRFFLGGNDIETAHVTEIVDPYNFKTDDGSEYKLETL